MVNFMLLSALFELGHIFVENSVANENNIPYNLCLLCPYAF